MGLSLRSVTKQFGRVPALSQVDLEIAEGEFVALLGPSGSGKTTLLRVIAGLEKPDGGQVMFAGQDFTRLSPAARGVGFVFQHYALFEHMTVAANVAFGLEAQRRLSRAAVRDRVEELLNLTQIGHLASRRPGRLSGGERQRVALARALAVSPRMLLLDEPFGALDATVRKSLRTELRRIHDAADVATLFVTHDQDEALELADRVAVLNAGRIEQVGTPDEIRDNPASAFVCGFVGAASRLEGRVRAGRFEAGGLWLPAPGKPDGPAIAFVRPYDWRLGDEGFAVSVTGRSTRGAVESLDVVASDGRRLEVECGRGEAGDVQPGAQVNLQAVRAHIFAA